VNNSCSRNSNTRPVDPKSSVLTGIRTNDGHPGGGFVRIPRTAIVHVEAPRSLAEATAGAMRFGSKIKPSPG